MAINRFSWITAMALGCWAAVAEGQAPDTTPPGMVAFFMTDSAGCPAGWKVPDLPKGRVLVGAASGSTVGVTVNDAMRDRELPKHRHAVTLTFDLQSKKIAGGGGDNHQGAKSGKHSFAKETELAESGWGFTQLTVCEKQ
jgi:hypothetical protein